MGIVMSVTPMKPPWNVACREAVDISEGFDSLFSEIIKDNPDTGRFLKNLDAYSSETFNHSVNVALHVYDELTRSGQYSHRDVKAWVDAALWHDAGKLETPLAVLHVTVDKETLLPEEKKQFDADMMAHSFKGLDYADTHGYELTNQQKAAIVGHHVNSKALRTEGFKGATASKWNWKDIFPEGYIESTLQEVMAFAKPRDIKAVETIAFCDVIEAIRSEDRRYQMQHDWDKDQVDVQVDKNGDGRTVSPGLSVTSIVEGKKEDVLLAYNPVTGAPIVGKPAGDINKGALSEDFRGKVLDREFRTRFTALQECEKPSYVRSVIAEKFKDHKCELSSDKQKDIKQNPYLGYEFFEKQFTEKGVVWTVDLGMEGKLTVPSLPGGTRPNLSIGTDFYVASSKEIKNDVENNLDQVLSDEKDGISMDDIV